jgi:hypothetical protein
MTRATYTLSKPQDMYCNDWSADPKDSSWWMPVAFLTSVSGRAHAGFICLKPLRLGRTWSHANPRGPLGRPSCGALRLL